MKILSAFPNDINHIIYFEHPLKRTPDLGKVAAVDANAQKQQEYNNIGIVGGCSDPKMPSIATIPLTKLELDGLVGKENKRASNAGKSK